MKTIINQFCKFSALAVLCVCWLSVDGVNAQALPFTPVYAPAVQGNTYTFGPQRLTSANAASFTFGPAANGAVYGSTPATFGTPAGNNLAVSVRNTISKPAAAAAIGKAGLRIAGALGGAATAWAVGSAIYDLANELGLDPSFGTKPDNLGKPVIHQYVDSVNCAAPSMCYVYSGNGGATYGSGQSVVSKFVADKMAANPGYVFVGTPYIPAPTHTSYDTQLGTLVYTGSMPGYSPRPQTADIQVKRVPETRDSVYTEQGLEHLESALNKPHAYAPNSALPRAIQDAASTLAPGESIETSSPTVTGPATGTPQTKTTTDPATNTTKTETKTEHYTYNGPNVQISNVTTNSTTNISTGETTQGPTTVENAPPPEKNVDVCGLPGKAACKIDETGTPEADAENKYDTKIEPVKTTIDTNRTVISGTADKPFFQGWGVFFDAPALVTCTPVVLPSFNGVTMGSIDPCPVVDGMRTVMAYIWAISGLMLCVGMVRKVV